MVATRHSSLVPVGLAASLPPPNKKKKICVAVGLVETVKTAGRERPSPLIRGLQAAVVNHRPEVRVHPPVVVVVHGCVRIHMPSWTRLASAIHRRPEACPSAGCRACPQLHPSPHARLERPCLLWFRPGVGGGLAIVPSNYIGENMLDEDDSTPSVGR